MNLQNAYAKKKRWIFVSPHFDDAVLSCGGLIYLLTESGIQVEIRTVNAGMPEPGSGTELINRIHSVWKTGTPEETINIRRMEDKCAAESLGASTCHLGIVDAIYRKNNGGDYFYTEDVFDPIHPDEKPIVDQAAKQIGTGINRDDQIVCPLALGGHVDHVICRMAVESLDITPMYYADIPYLFRNVDILASATSSLQGITWKLKKKDLFAWQSGITFYKSQLPSLFLNEDDMADQLTDYWRINKGITLWKKS